CSRGWWWEGSWRSGRRGAGRHDPLPVARVELDLLVSPTYEVFVKDEAHVAASAALGRFSEETAAEIHAVGARVKAEIEAGDRWWDEQWREWTPPADLLRPPVLPDGWQDVAAEDVVDLLATPASG
ncbi:MAG: hypothetical protein ABL966_11250, partial [Acidimicrobiales bacterium]